MFDIGAGEFLIIAIVALIAIGPKELPGVLRMVGQWVGKARGMARDFQGQFQEAMREADIAEMKRQFDEAADKASSYSPTNLLESANKDINEALMKPATPTAIAAPAADAATPEAQLTEGTVAETKPIEARDAEAKDIEKDAGSRADVLTDGKADASPEAATKPS